MAPMDEWRHIWGLNIQIARRRQGLSQRQLAEKLGLSQASIARWETGTSVPTDEHKLLIATELDEDVRSLFPLTRNGR